jgi:hypothetical protein
MEKYDLKLCKEKLKEQEDHEGITELWQTRVVEAEMTQEVIESISTVLESFRLSLIQYDTTAETVNELLPNLIDDAIKKLRALPDVVSEELEEEGTQLAHAITEHILVCFRSKDLA